MSYGFKVIAEGKLACFTRPEMKVERISYDVPTVGALEGMLKSVYWKPAIRYVIDKIVVFNPINFMNIRRNEIKDKVSLSSVRSQMNGGLSSPVICADSSRNQRASMILKNVRYGIEFHFVLTGLQNEREPAGDEKHYNIILRRLENGQYFRKPCMGCSEYPVDRLYLVDGFPLDEISPDIVRMGDVDLGYMLYRLNFRDGGIPAGGNWDAPVFSDSASAEYYRPHMVNGIIDVPLYREGKTC